MDEHRLLDMVQTVLQELAGPLRCHQVAGVERALRDYWGDSLVVTWHICDVQDVARGDDKVISNEQAREVLEYLECNHDPSRGITWNDIADYLMDHIYEDEEDDDSDDEE